MLEPSIKREEAWGDCTLTPLFSDFMGMSRPPSEYRLKDGRKAITFTRSNDRVSISDSCKLFADNIWPGALALADYLDVHRDLCAGKSVLELGAGCSLPGIVASLLGAHKVVISDFPEASIIRNIEAVIEQNHINDDLSYQKIVAAAATRTTTTAGTAYRPEEPVQQCDGCTSSHENNVELPSKRLSTRNHLVAECSRAVAVGYEWGAPVGPLLLCLRDYTWQTRQTGQSGQSIQARQSVQSEQVRAAGHTGNYYCQSSDGWNDLGEASEHDDGGHGGDTLGGPRPEAALALAPTAGFDLVLVAEPLWKDTVHLHSALLRSIAGTLRVPHASSSPSFVGEEEFRGSGGGGGGEGEGGGVCLVSFVHRSTAQHRPEHDLAFFRLAQEQHGLNSTFLESCSSYCEPHEIDDAQPAAAAAVATTESLELKVREAAAPDKALVHIYALHYTAEPPHGLLPTKAELESLT